MCLEDEDKIGKEQRTRMASGEGADQVARSQEVGTEA